ncbi:RHOD [Musa troglodytarum]|uniref:RHOD n=1 Tax=Musa troglodytarum TaxID=320322 RepID=A0A9E7EYT0_9LILI|nr:RHOD [Musa troglodytarum]URD84271.1 RHOD [Musa troglodytarum]URD84273.1 RHOD [Musa troglodytarum]URD84276.1 RHOD [Musa troglodytarum]URD84277.1 RHOD [Musa troglodytarum]
MSSCFLRSSLRLRLFSLLRRSEPTMAAAHPFAPHRTARPHVPYAALRQRPTLFRYYGCVAEVAAEPRSVPVTVVHERRQGPILLRSMSSNANAEEAVMPRSVPVAVAHELLTAGHRYLDVRTLKEFIGGHAVGAVNIPYMLESVSENWMAQNLVQQVEEEVLISGAAAFTLAENQ